MENFIKKITKKQAHRNRGRQHEPQRTQLGNFSVVDFSRRLRNHRSSIKVLFTGEKHSPLLNYYWISSACQEIKLEGKNKKGTVLFFHMHNKAWLRFLEKIEPSPLMLIWIA